MNMLSIVNSRSSIEFTFMINAITKFDFVFEFIFELNKSNFEFDDKIIALAS